MEDDVLTLMGGPALLRLPDACRYLGLGRSKLYELIQQQQIQIVKVGGRTLVPVVSLQEFVRKLPSVSRPPRGER
jgi:excisionase family DNA binding protein